MPSFKNFDSSKLWGRRRLLQVGLGGAALAGTASGYHWLNRGSMAMGKPKININTAILSELDKLEAALGVPALSNKIQASRPYGSIEDLVSKKVISQAQFDQIKNQVTIEEIKLTGEARDVDYMTKLALMKGHMIVAGELLALKKSDQAEPHIGHPVEEIYVDLEEQFQERKVEDFKGGADPTARSGQVQAQRFST